MTKEFAYEPLFFQFYLSSTVFCSPTAGFGENTITIRQIYSYQSGYIHADGLSGAQVFGLKTMQEQIEFIEINMRIVMIVLSKLIIEYSKKFPEAKAACEKNVEIFNRAQVWSGSVQLLP